MFATPDCIGRLRWRNWVESIEQVLSKPKKSSVTDDCAG